MGTADVSLVENLAGYHLPCQFLFTTMLQGGEDCSNAVERRQNVGHVRVLQS